MAITTDMRNMVGERNPNKSVHWYGFQRKILERAERWCRIMYICRHLAGPSAIKPLTRQIQAALATRRFQYVMRIDIRSYYASIDHRLLIQQVRQHFADPVVLKYLEDIITIGVDCGGQVCLPQQGIPRQSALSPFLGALYLSDLDQAFTHRKGVFYGRYMDDILVLTETKRQYRKA